MSKTTGHAATREGPWAVHPWWTGCGYSVHRCTVDQGGAQRRVLQRTAGRDGGTIAGAGELMVAALWGMAKPSEGTGALRG